MCGITAAVGPNLKASIQTVSYGLTALQNRGNDSFGLACFSRASTSTPDENSQRLPSLTPSPLEMQIKVKKHANPNKEYFENLMKNDISELEKLEGPGIALGHCRWATHGANTDINAHPHLDNSGCFAIVHNGTINNYLPLKEMLLERGYHFSSDTDTEVIVNLISHYYYEGEPKANSSSTTDLILNEREKILKAVNLTINKLQGTWACVLISTKIPNIITVFSRTCPLVIGWSANFDNMMCASELSAFDQNICYYGRLKNDFPFQWGGEQSPPLPPLQNGQSSPLLPLTPLKGGQSSSLLHLPPLQGGQSSSLLHLPPLQGGQSPHLESRLQGHKQKQEEVDISLFQKSYPFPVEWKQNPELIPIEGGLAGIRFPPKLAMELSPFPHAHWMLKEIYHQQVCSSNLIGEYLKDAHLDLPLDLGYFVNAQHLILIGCGTSYYAGKYARQFFTDLKIYKTVQCLDASEFDFSYLPNDQNIICLLLSQSGETMDLIKVQERLKAHSIINIAVVNVENSSISAASDQAFFIKSGREVAVASTKSYTNQVLALRLIALWIEQHFPKLLSTVNQMKSIINLPNQIGEIIQSCNTEVRQWAENLVSCERVFILGRKASFNIAKEAALKLKEVGYIHSEAYSTGALKHGPYSLIEVGKPIIFILTSNEDDHNVINTMMELRSRGALIYLVTDHKVDLTSLVMGSSDRIIILPHNDDLPGLLQIIPFQLLAYHLALKKGHNPDFPRNLAKSVTVD